MQLNPLDLPADQHLLIRFLSRLQIDPSQDPQSLLRDVVEAFSKLPYENLTKIIKFDECRSIPAARQTPLEILDNHFRWGTGGTCFSLTATLLHLVRSLGFEAQPILADRSYGPNTHCAMLVWIDGHPCLIDPGFLLIDPIPLSNAQQTIATPFNRLVLSPHGTDANKLDLGSIENGQAKYRLTYKTSPVDAGEFLRAWDESFSWEMMRYPVLSRITGRSQIYQRGRYWQLREHDSIVRKEISPIEVAAQIASQFGIDRQLAEKALSLLPDYRR